MNNPSARQVEVLNVIYQYIHTFGFSPTVQDVASIMKVKSTTSAKRFIELFCSNKWIKKHENKYRSITVLNPGIELLKQRGYIPEDATKEAEKDRRLDFDALDNTDQNFILVYLTLPDNMKTVLRKSVHKALNPSVYA